MPDVPNQVLDEFLIQMDHVFESAPPLSDLGESGWFPPEDWKIIQREVRRMLYVLSLPYGGTAERKLADFMWEMARIDWSFKQLARTAAEAWSSVAGCYYVRKPMLEKRDNTQFEALQTLKRISAEHQHWVQKRFAEEMLKGLPEKISNFILQPKYLLVKADKKRRERKMVLRNVMGEVSEIVSFNSKDWSGPKDLRIRLNDCGNFVFKAGERELNDLQEDVANLMAFREVQEVDSIGWLAPDPSDEEENFLGGTWFLGDCAVSATGQIIMPDEEGIIWIGDRGYVLADRGREGKFVQGEPKLRPHIKIESAQIPCLSDNSVTPQERLRDFLREFAGVMDASMGGFEGRLMIGSMFSFTAAPEIYRQFKCFPGLWVHGEPGSGKSSTTDSLMRIWGFSLGKGLDIIKNVTVPGIQMAGEQYSNLPVWLDEFRNDEVDEAKLAILRSTYMRGGMAKCTHDGEQRELRTAFIVSGDSTTSDAATRGRFPHVQVAATKRAYDGDPVITAEVLLWFKQHDPFLFLFGRFLLENRREYVQRVLERLNEWRLAGGTKGISERDKLVYGVPCAAFIAAAEMLQMDTPENLAMFRARVLLRAREAAADVKGQQRINTFFDDLLAAVNIGAVSVDHFQFEIIGISPHPPGAPNQGPWKEVILWMSPNEVLAELNIFMGQQRAKAVLQKNDLRDQLSKQPYWRGSEGISFKGRDTNTRCWALSLTDHPLGYQQISDEKYQAFLQNPEKGDPREGPLFGIVNKLKKR